MKRNILLFGSSSKLSLNILYCLKDSAFAVHFLSNNIKNAAKYSKLTASYQLVSGESWKLEDVVKVILSRKIDLLMPVGEAEVLFIEANQTELENYCKCQWVTPAKEFKSAINKHLLAAELQKIGVSIPLHVSITDEEDIIAFTKTNGFPVLIKPTRSSFGWGIRKFNSLEKLLSHFKKYNLYKEEYILQQFIVGSDISCNILSERGQIICYTIKESPVRYGSNFNPHDTIMFGPDQNVINQVSKIIAQFKWHGIANVNIRRDYKNQEIYILEINGRYWGSVISSLKRAGINFPDIAAHYGLGERITIPEMGTGLQVSFARFLRSLLSFKPFSIDDTKFHSYTQDPIARIMQMTEKFR
jgi:predicted ATP-grasp superfamily ATP-dependent carboligase